MTTMKLYYLITPKARFILKEIAQQSKFNNPSMTLENHAEMLFYDLGAGR